MTETYDNNKETDLLGLLERIDKNLAEFCRNNAILDDEEIEEIWKMFRNGKEILN